jgi:hypothetical protein
MFVGFESTLKEKSLDDTNNEYLVQNEVVCIDFDKCKNDYCEHSPGENKCGYLKSVDAIIERGSKVYFIEFKNTKIDEKLVYVIVEKCYDSLLLYFEKTGKNISDSRQNFSFTLVTNYGNKADAVNSKEMIVQTVVGKADEKWKKYKKKFESFFFIGMNIFEPVVFNNYLIKERLIP